MPTCTFFGHRDCTDAIKPLLSRTIENLIAVEGVSLFYVGNQGNFDALAIKVLKDLQQKHPHIKYYIVHAYFPRNPSSENTILPDGIEKVPKQFAISHRNRWMLKQSDYVVVYVTRSFGGAANFLKQAINSNKRVTNIASLM